MTIPVEQAKVSLEWLIARSAAGEEIVITRDGKPVAHVVAAPTVASNGTPATSQANAPREPGWGKGIITYIAPDFDAPLEDFKEYME